MSRGPSNPASASGDFTARTTITGVRHSPMTIRADGETCGVRRFVLSTWSGLLSTLTRTP